MSTGKPPALPRPLIWLLFAALLLALCSGAGATDAGGGSSDSAITYTTSGTWVKLSESTTDGVTTTTYGMDTDSSKDGYEITLVCQGNEWTYYFSVADAKAQYYVYEVLNNVSGTDVSSQWTLTDADGNPISYVTIQDGETGILYNVENTYGIPDYGSLSLTKKLLAYDGTAGTDTSTSFAFDVTLTYIPTGSETVDITPLLTGAQSYGDATFTWAEADGTYTATARVSLKAGETVNLTDIPAGVSWAITEVTEGYTRAWSKTETASGTTSDAVTLTETNGAVTGTVAANTAAAVTCTNTEPQPEEPTPETELGSVVIGKTVQNEDGSAVTDDETAFSFRAVFSGLTAGGTYSYTVYDAAGTAGTAQTFAALADGSAVVDFTLTNGQYAVFSDLPVGATYQAIEYAADGYTASYALTNFTSVASSAGENYTANADLTTGKETLDSGEANKGTDESVRIQFTNTKPTPEPEQALIDILVQKTWSDAVSGADHTGAAVTIYLYRAETQEEADSGQGNLVGSVTLDGVTDELETTAWQYTFAGLDRYVDESQTDEWVYYVQEPTPPAGFGAEVTPETGTDTDGDGTLTFTVCNVKGASLPDSGGSGTAPYGCIGLLLMAAAAAVYGCKRHSMGRRQAH